MRDVPTLTTDRFTLRPLQRGDEVALFPTLSDEEQCRYLSEPPFESAEKLWDWFADPTWNGRTWIAVDAQGDVVARLVAVPTHDPKIEEIGYIVAKHRQREGIAREVAQALIAQLWTEGLRKITAETDPRNKGSIALLEALGFTREAHLRQHEVTHIGVCDLYLYGLLASDV